MSSYQHTIDEIGVCTHKSNVHTEYTRSTTKPEEFVSPQDTQPYAVVMSTGICEMHKIQIQNFRPLVSKIVQFVHESCTGHMQANVVQTTDTESAAPSAEHAAQDSVSYSGASVKTRNIFIFKLEEAIDVKIVIAQPLYEANDYVYNHVIPALNRNLPIHARIPILDTYHVSRA